LGRAVAPVFDLFLRLYLAQIFLISGLLKISHWDTALNLAAYEYPVAWLDPATAAVLGAAVELVCPIFLALGLATRLAALPLLALTVVIQLEYKALDEHLFWMALFGWYVVMGAGRLSLDRRLGRGLADSALPLARPLAALFSTLTRYAGPVYQVFARAWLALLLFHSGLGPVLEYAVPVLLITGLATRPAALAAGVAVGLAVLAPAAVHSNAFYELLLLALLVLHGAGPLSLDRLAGRALRRRFPQLEGRLAADPEQLPQVVIVGAGFGGLAAARGLRNAACRVTVIDRRNHHLFQPLLYQVATASLSPADIAVPIRELFRDQPNARVLLGEVSGVDTLRREVVMAGGRVHYDFLVLATGARHSYFGRDDWEPFAPGLKRIEDATAIRRRLLLAFEQAESCRDPEERARLLTFVVIGGGPTGVELAGAIVELARHGMEGEFRAIDPAAARVLLVEAGPRLLAAFPESLSATAAQSLAELGVEVLAGGRVEQVDADGVTVNGGRIAARTVFWGAGVMASPAARWLGAESDRSGRVKVGPELAVAGLTDVFAIGDTALSEGWDGRPVPGLAPAAKQGGDHVAKVIRARLEGRKPPRPFRYRHKGSLATIGRKAAVADFGWIRLKGAVAWWLWGAVHVFFLAGMRNRMGVALEWFWAYLTFRRGTRLITGAEGTPAVMEQQPAADRLRQLA
ncbi:MAG: FAD-dependent oxidoreductase, partial [Pseudomonadota bacterium]|nr:FAD-dependent oxidoreductase [Pseudomonadota bacterium]